MLRILTLALALFVLAACNAPAPETDTEEQRDRLRRGLSTEPGTLDPAQVTIIAEFLVVLDLFDGLYTTGADGRPVLAAAEGVEVDDGQTVYTFTLAERAWSDGQPVTAEDFAFAFRRLLDPATAAPYASIFYVIENAEAVNAGELAPDALGVRALDTRTLELRLNRPAPYLPALLAKPMAMPLPRHLIEAEGERWSQAGTMVTNGPYRLADWRTGSAILLEANPAWHGAEALCFDEIAYLPMADLSAAERRAEAGELDVHMTFDAARRDEIERRLPGWTRSHPALWSVYFQFNLRAPPFDDVRVRRALSLALDQDFINRAVWAGSLKPGDRFVPPGIDHYVPEADRPRLDWLGRSRPERLAEARALLEAAGYGPDNPLRFEFLYAIGSTSQRMAPIAEANWAEIADWVRPQLLAQDSRILFQRLNTGDFSYAAANWVADFDDPFTFLGILHSEAGMLNDGGYSNPTFDALLEDANRQTDLMRRAERFAEAEAILLEELPFTPVGFPETRALVSPDLTGWVDNPRLLNPSRYLCRQAR